MSSTSHDEAAPLPTDAQGVRQLVTRAREGVATVLSDGGENVAAIVPIGVLDEIMDRQIRAAVERAAERGAGTSPGVDHSEWMASIGRDLHGRAA